jgi:hypothetical protein
MSNELAKYNPFSVTSVEKVEVMKYGMSISDLSKIDSKKTTIGIAKILAKYLSITPKAAGINETMYEMIIEHIIVNCKNLELQEIDFIIKKGVMGVFGTIYAEISIDTITGVDGWIETYYKTYRKQRIEQRIEPKFELTGKEMTYEEFINRNQEFNKKEIENIKILASNYNVSTDLLKDHFGNKYEAIVKQAEEIYIQALDQFIALEAQIKAIKKFSEKEPFLVIKNQLKNILKYDKDEFVRRNLNEQVNKINSKQINWK